MIKYACFVLLACINSLAFAETNYEKIEVGTVVQEGIGLGSFLKPIPLPAGEWLVVSKRTEDIELTNSRTGNVKLPRYFLTLKNQHAAESPIFALLVSFTPEALTVNWGNRKCENSNPKAIVDDFGFNADSMLYACAVTWSVDNLKNTILKSVESKNKWRQQNLSGLAAYPDDISDKALEVNIGGNRYKGTNIGFTFFVKRTGDVANDPAYASYVKDWVHATGLALLEILNNNNATFELPKAYVVQ